ncbi:unnamed protein product [Arctogadus glacialis]
MTGVSAAARTARKEESREQVALWSLKIERAKGQLANSLVLAGVPRGTPNPVLLRFQPGDGVAVAEAVAGEERYAADTFEQRWFQECERRAGSQGQSEAQCWALIDWTMIMKKTHITYVHFPKLLEKLQKPQSVFQRDVIQKDSKMSCLANRLATGNKQDKPVGC